METRPSRILERDSELAAAERLLDALLNDGTGGALVLRGAPGLGKSALLARLAAEGDERGARVLRVRCSGLERDVANGVVRGLFERAVGPGAHESAWEGFASAARPLFEPVGAAGQPAKLPDADALLHALYWLASNLSYEQPTILIVDDLHDCDPSSLRALAYLARRLDELPLALAVATRPVEPPNAEASQIQAVAERGGNLVEPHSLTVAGVAAMLEDVLGQEPEDDLVAACFEATRGNPELVRTIASEALIEGMPSAEEVGMFAPATVVRVILDRLARMGPAEQSVAEAVTVLGGQATSARVAAVTELNADDVRDAIRALEAAGVLAPGLPLAPIHPTVGEAIEDGIRPVDRSALHARSAVVMEEEGLGTDFRAAHLVHTEPGAAAGTVEVLLEAASEATRRGAPEVAARYGERALAEPPSPELRPQVLSRLGRSLCRAGDQSGLAFLREALAEERDDLARMRLVYDLGRALTGFGRWKEATAHFEWAADELGDIHEEVALLLDCFAMMARWGGGEPMGAVPERIKATRTTATGVTPGERLALGILAWSAAAEASDATEVGRLATRALGLDAGIEEFDARDPVLVTAVGSLTAVDEYEVARRVVEDAMKGAATRGSEPTYRLAGGLAMIIAHRSGGVRETIELGGLVRIEDLNWDHSELQVARGCFGSALVQAGDLDRARAFLGYEEDHGPVKELLGYEMVSYALGALAAAEGDFERALAQYLDAGEALQRHGAPGPNIVPWRMEATLVALRRNRDALAEELSADDLERAERYGARGSIAQALIGRGVVLAGADGRAALERAINEADAVGNLGDADLARVELGSLLRREGEDRAARDPLRKALEGANMRGAGALADRAREELVAAGGRPRRTALSGPDSLTPSEIRISRLAGEGRSNREIAQQLFLSIKTVEMHLRNSYRKLDINSRDELPGALTPD